MRRRTALAVAIAIASLAACRPAADGGPAAPANPLEAAARDAHLLDAPDPANGVDDPPAKAVDANVKQP